MSISTPYGDAGQTSLQGGTRLSKADLRDEAYGTIDELISSLRLVSALCRNPEIDTLTASLQRELASIALCLSALPDSRKGQSQTGEENADRLTAEVHRIEGTKGLPGDRALPGADVGSAAFDVDRTVGRRAERLALRLLQDDPIDPNVLGYLTRLSDLLWLFGRLIEVERSVDSKLRGSEDSGARWSRAW